MILLLAVALAGCNLARLGYRNGETITYYWLNSYIGFDDDQRFWVSREIDTLFAWHRRTQLAHYADFLDSLQKRAAAPVSPADLQADVAKLRGFALEVFDRAMPVMADLALALTPEQLTHIEKKFAANDKAFRKEFLRGDVAQQQQARFKQVMKHAEYWFGDFSPEQEARIRTVSDARPLDNETILAMRRERQAALLALLRKIREDRPARPAAAAMLQAFLTTTLERRGDPRQHEFFEAYRAANLELAAMIANSATPRQKQHFLDVTQKWIEDFHALQR
ncbi:MAG: DUF6279 family lipoprotein [Noviherbaspirillum sp.]